MSAHRVGLAPPTASLPSTTVPQPARPTMDLRDPQHGVGWVCCNHCYRVQRNLGVSVFTAFRRAINCWNPTP